MLEGDPQLSRREDPGAGEQAGDFRELVLVVGRENHFKLHHAVLRLCGSYTALSLRFNQNSPESTVPLGTPSAVAISRFVGASPTRAIRAMASLARFLILASLHVSSARRRGSISWRSSASRSRDCAKARLRRARSVSRRSSRGSRRRQSSAASSESRPAVTPQSAASGPMRRASRVRAHLRTRKSRLPPVRIAPDRRSKLQRITQQYSTLLLKRGELRGGTWGTRLDSKRGVPRSLETLAVAGEVAELPREHRAQVGLERLALVAEPVEQAHQPWVEEEVELAARILVPILIFETRNFSHPSDRIGNGIKLPDLPLHEKVTAKSATKLSCSGRRGRARFNGDRHFIPGSAVEDSSRRLLVEAAPSV